MGDGDDHVLARDQVLVLEVALTVGDAGQARRRELVAHRDQFVADDGDDLVARAQYFQEAGNGVRQGLGLFTDFLAAEPGQARQGQGQDGARLFVGQAHISAAQDDRARIGDQVDQRRHVTGRPDLAAQALARLRRIGRRTDDVDDFVDIGDGDGQPDQHVAAVARLVQFEADAADDDFLAEFEEDVQQLAQAHLLRLAVVERQHIDAERGLQRRHAEQLVEDDIARRVALQFDDDAHALAVAFVADIGNAFDALVAHQFGDVLDHRRLVHLIGDFGDDDGVAVLADRLDRRLAARHH